MAKKTKKKYNKIKEEIDKMKNPYPLTVSDWINILHEKVSRSYHLELYVFIGILTAIFGVPALIDYAGYSEIGLGWFKPILMLMMLFSLYCIYIIINRNNRMTNKPYKQLLEKIINGEITEPRKILEEYRQIDNPEKNE